MSAENAGAGPAPASAATVMTLANPHPAAVPPAGGGARPLTVNYNVAAPAPMASNAAAAPAQAASTQQMVAIPLEQLQAFANVQARLAQMEADQRTQESAAQQEQARILAQKGEVQNALTMLREESERRLQEERTKRQATEAAAGRYALDGELGRALASQPLLPHAAEQLTTLWRGNFSAVNENGTYAVRTPQFETPAQFVQRQLSDPAYAHFLRPQNPGGGTQTGQTAQAGPTPSAQPTPAPQPRNMGEAVILHMQGLQKAQGDARANLQLPMGLHPTR